MAKTVVGLFDTMSSAQNTLQALIDSGISRDDISLVANNASGEYTVNEGTSHTAEGAATGAVGGGVLGGVLGLLVGIGALAIPGIGPVLAAGPIAAALGSAGATALVGAGIGAVSGGLLGALVGAGVPEEDAHYYAEGVRRGGTLVLAKVDDSHANIAYSVMQQHGAVDIDERGTQWRESGWDRFNPDADENDGNEWERSSKIGTGGGAVAGAATGAAIGSVGGPVGTAIGGIAGAATGAGIGAAGDAAGEEATEGSATRDYDRTAAADRPTGDLTERQSATAFGGAGTAYGSTTGPTSGGFGMDATTTHAGAGTAVAGLMGPRVYDESGARVRDYERTTQGYSDATQFREDQMQQDWRESSKVGTVTGTAAGAATGAVMGSAGGPIGTVIGGIAGAAVGAAAGAAGDAAGEAASDDSHGEDDAGRKGQVTPH